MSRHNPPASRGGESLLDTSQLASLLACSPRHVDRLLKQGRLPAPVRLGSLRRWRSSQIQQWLTSQKPDREGVHDGL